MDLAVPDGATILNLVQYFLQLVVTLLLAGPPVDLGSGHVGLEQVLVLVLLQSGRERLDFLGLALWSLPIECLALLNCRHNVGVQGVVVIADVGQRSGVLVLVLYNASHPI